MANVSGLTCVVSPRCESQDYSDSANNTKTAKLKVTGEHEHRAGTISREADKITFFSKMSPLKSFLRIKVVFKSPWERLVPGKWNLL